MSSDIQIPDNAAGRKRSPYNREVTKRFQEKVEREIARRNEAVAQEQAAREKSVVFWVARKRTLEAKLAAMPFPFTVELHCDDATAATFARLKGRTEALYTELLERVKDRKNGFVIVALEIMFALLSALMIYRVALPHLEVLEGLMPVNFALMAGVEEEGLQLFVNVFFFEFLTIAAGSLLLMHLFRPAVSRPGFGRAGAWIVGCSYLLLTLMSVLSMVA